MASDKPQEQPPPRRFNFRWLLLVALGFLLLQGLTRNALRPEIKFSEFQQLVSEGKVSRAVVGTREIRGELEGDEGGRERFVTTRVDPEVAELLDANGVEYSGQAESTWLPLVLSWMVPILLIVGLWIFMARRFARQAGGGGFMSIGKSRAKIAVETDLQTGFEDVAGVEEATDELKELVAFLKNPEGYGRLGARMPKGVLLVGPPGTGKTLLARAVAGEAGVPFFSISGSEFVEMFVGVGAARVRDLFEQARRKAPCIIFVDELDALGRARNTAMGFGGHDEKEQTLNQLLVELDGFDSSSGVVLLGATNRPEVLDPALLRAGRFDRQVLVDRPDRTGRVAILAVHARRVKLQAGTDLDEVAAMTPGFTGADLANLVNEAALAATRRGGQDVSLADFTTAVERIVAGLEKKNRLLNSCEREIVAVHEMGHALVASALPGTDPVHKVSIIPRGIGALGYTIQRPTEDRFLMTREELEHKMTVLLGGRAAEHLVFGHLSTGAGDDLARATDIAREMVTRYAMIPELGNSTYATEQRGFLPGMPAPATASYSEATAREIDCAIRSLVDAAFERACLELERNRQLLEDGARELVASESLAGEALDALLQRTSRAPRIATA